MAGTIDSTPALPADGMAKRIVRHYQAEGFVGISEALILRIRLKKGDRREVEAAFDAAVEKGKMLPLHDQFEVRAIGHFAQSRSFAEAKATIQSDFTAALRREMPGLFFDPAPVLIDDPLASGTKYDAMVKLWDNLEDCAYAILLNDPDASFIDYLGSKHGDDWQQLMGDFGATAESFCPEIDLV
ncbi:MAG: hypothetical protein WAO76_02825 [Georgfuchsia sp.]